MKLTAATDAIIARLSADLEQEEDAIARAVAARQIADGSGYWRKRHVIERRLDAARALREALSEALT